jgi:glycosyltransferase involved in cell wall biosynthesis
MKLLYVTSKPAYPTVDGGCVAIQRFLETLIQGGHDISLLTFQTHKHPFDNSSWPVDIQERIHIESIFVDTKVKAISLLSKTAKGASYHLSRFRSPQLNAKFRELISSNSFDAIILDGLYSAACIETIRLHSTCKVCVRTHNVEHEVWKTLAINSRNFLKSLIIRRLSILLQKEEVQLLNAVDGIFSISPEDSKKFKALGIKTPIYEIPVSVNLAEPSKSTDSNQFFFLGGMDWMPNREAVDLLISEIFPQIMAKIPSAVLHIAGVGTEQLQGGKGIKCYGFVPDSMEFMRQSGTLLLPLKSGSGVRMKLLEAMRIGVPIVTTTIGKEGIDAFDCMAIGDTTDAFVSAAIALNEDCDLKKKFAQNSRAFIQENYSPTTIAATLNEVLR